MTKKSALSIGSIILMLTVLVLPIHAQILYTQNTLAVGDVIAKEDLDFGGGAIARVADDFEVPAGQTWTISQVDLPGRYRYADANGNGYLTDRAGSVTLTIYTNNAGMPGSIVYDSIIILPPSSLDPDLEVVLPASITLTSGIYWMAVYTDDCCYENSQSWYWKTTATVVHHPALLRSQLETATDVINWSPVYQVYPQAPVDMLFTLHGTSTGTAGPAAPDSLMVWADSVSFVLNWKDNAGDETGFVIERSTDSISFYTRATVSAGTTTYTDFDNFDLTLRYYYRVAATNAVGNSVYSDVAFADQTKVVYEQTGPGPDNGAPSQQWRDRSENGTEGPWQHDMVRSADDLVIPANQTWTLKKIIVPSAAFYPASAALENATVEIFSDGSAYEIPGGDTTYVVSSQPGTSIYKTLILIPYTQRSNANLELVLPRPLQLTSGHYWISVYPTLETDNFWYWAATDSVHNVVAQENDVRTAPTPPWKPVFLAEGFDAAADLVFTLLGAVTSADTLSPPVAKPALHVTPTSFTANWTAVTGADHYELDVIAVKDSTFLAGYESKVVNGTMQEVTGTIPGRRYEYVVRAVNASGESMNSNIIVVAPVKDLTLRTVCSDNPAAYRRWKIINNNPFAVDVTWQVLNTTQTGMLSAGTGETFFTTQTVAGINYVSVKWYDDNNNQHASLKSSTWKSCEQILARGGNVNDDVEEEIFAVTSYPNPATDKLNIAVTTPDDTPVHVEILNLQGQRMFHTATEGNRVFETDVTSYTPGLYLIRARQGNNVSTVKVMKQ